MYNLHKIKKYFNPRTILDIGAHVGHWHVHARSVFENSYIFSIEASESCEPHLKEITNQYFIGLLAKENKEYDFYTRKDVPFATGDSIYKELTHFYNDDNLNIIKKQGITLDSLFPGGFMFDLIKIDTQGSELDIISGGTSVCSKATGILLEVALEQYNEAAPTIDEVNLFMEDFGYIPVEILEDIRHPTSHQPIQQDILYIRK